MATGYAKMKNRLGALACSTSIGPGATNMITGAATATVNRLPVLCLPSDIFASRRTGPVLQQLESNFSWDYSANDAFKAVSKYWDRINRPDQLPTALLEAMRTLTSPADTGAVTLALPQDVQAEAWDFPTALFRERTWYVPRARADRGALRRAAQLIAGAKRPVIIAGGGVIYSAATDELADFAAKTGIPVGVTQAGKAALPYDHPQMVNALGASGSVFANALANQADLIIGIGTRYTDFTTASNTMFSTEGVQFVNLNVTELDAYKESALGLVGDARETLLELADLLGDHQVDAAYRAEVEKAADGWRAEVDRIVEIQNGPTLSQAEAIGIVNAAAGDHHVVVNAAGSMPGDLHRLWRPSDPKAYDLEYGNSCMGYEVGGALGAKMADPTRDVFCFIGDGTFLLSSQEIMTAVQEGLKLTVLLVDNYGYGSIAALSETRGSQAFACRFNYRGEDGQFSDDRIDIDLAANAASYGADVLTATTAEELKQALDRGRRDRQHGRHLRQGRRQGPLRRVGRLVGRTGLGGLRGRQHPAGPQGVRGRGREPEALPVTATADAQVLRDVPTELIIGGEHRAASDGATFEVIDPATGDALTTVASGTVEDAIACVDAAVGRRRGVGGHRAAEAVGDPAADLPADDRAGRRPGPADHRGERQGPARRPRRGAVLGGVLPLVRRGGRPDPWRHPGRTRRRQQDHRVAPARRGRGPGHPVELPGRHGRAQDRPGAGRRLHRHPQAGRRDPADRARDRRPDGGGRSAGRGGQRAAVARSRRRWSRRCSPTRGSASCPSPARPRSAARC